MSNLFNGLWMAAPGAAIVAPSLINSNTSNQEMQQQKDGGYIQNNNSNTWLEQYN
jgi:hypothetical protein